MTESTADAIDVAAARKAIDESGPVMSLAAFRTTLPTIGRIVHYQSFGTPGGEYLPEPRAAIITTVHHGDPVPEHGVPYIDAAVLNPTGMFFSQNLPYSETPKPGHWSWPPRI